MSAAAEEEAAATYDFDEAFQTKIIALTLRDSTFLSRVDGLVRPEYFENEAEATIARICLDHYRTYKQAPDKGSIATLLKTAIADKRLRKDLIEPVKEQVKVAFKADISDRNFVIDQIAGFARARATENAMIQSVELMQKGQFDEILKVMQAAINVGAGDEDLGYDYWQEIENRTQERIDLIAGKIKPTGITTGIKDLDAELLHSGWGRKEMSIVMGGAKAGKSMAIWDFAKNASLAGHSVLGITLEVSKKIISDRMDASASDVVIKMLKNRPNDVKHAISALRAKSGPLIVHEYASGTYRVSQLRRLLERYRAKGVMFDLVVVDYADIMRPEKSQNEKRFESDQIYVDLRGVAFDYNVALLTATQTNREGMKSTVAKATDVAEDISKIRHADVVISINATEAEKASGEARLFFAASRNTESSFSLRVKQDRSKMQFINKVLGREMP